MNCMVGSDFHLSELGKGSVHYLFYIILLSLILFWNIIGYEVVAEVFNGDAWGLPAYLLVGAFALCFL